MQNDKLTQFLTINELQSSPDALHIDLRNDAGEYSQLIGLKTRFNESDESSDLAEIKKQLKRSDVQKKTGSEKKHEEKYNWSHIDAITFYAEIGLKGDLYFRMLEETKSTIKKPQNDKETIDDLVLRDLKRHTECMSLLRSELLLETTITKPAKSRTNLSYKPIFNTGAE